MPRGCRLLGSLVVCVTLASICLAIFQTLSINLYRQAYRLPLPEILEGYEKRYVFIVGTLFNDSDPASTWVLDIPTILAGTLLTWLYLRVFDNRFKPYTIGQGQR